MACSTINLTFVSEALTSQIIHCNIDKDLDCDSDHPISPVVNWPWKAVNPIRQRLWSKTNIDTPPDSQGTSCTWARSISLTRVILTHTCHTPLTHSRLALMHQRLGQTRPHAQSQDLTKNARTSAAKCSSHAEDGNGQEMRMLRGLSTSMQ